MPLPVLPLPPLSLTETFVVRANETAANGVIAAPALCNYLQELAGAHADLLGVGIDSLRKKGVTWMLASLHLVFHSQPLWRDRLTVRTWPSGCRGRLIATRDFIVTNEAGGPVLAGVSEWLLVEHATLKITRLPDTLRALVPDDTPRAPVPEAEKIPDLPTPQWSARFDVRRSDLDLNRHANNVHYVEWLLEALPDAITERPLARLDVTYRAGANRGDTVVSEAAARDADTVVHRITRASDGALLTQARTTWAPCC